MATVEKVRNDVTPVITKITCEHGHALCIAWDPNTHRLLMACEVCKTGTWAIEHEGFRGTITTELIAW